ncbi:unnamed protein product [Moneuplotes crassus]|uniref:Kinesin motor domain-containing protein n=1 Tax=Euplotes crassus TaxID=5936 RepID=A0AAD2DBT0_EUPCR|nr:unnamed protein product [Moneuplotes crassus]
MNISKTTRNLVKAKNNGKGLKISQSQIALQKGTKTRRNLRSSKKDPLLKLHKIEPDQTSKKKGKKATKSIKEDDSPTFSDYYEEQKDIVGQMDNQVYEEKANHIKCCVRVRPLIDEEIVKDECISYPKPNTILVSANSKSVEKTYDQVFPQDAQQSDVYSFISDAVGGILKGVNCTILAYGQKNTGKSYTMFGQNWETRVKEIATRTLECLREGKQYDGNESELYDLGLIPRSIQEVFYYLNSNNIDPTKVKVYLSFVQIHNEKIYDLLQDSDTKEDLKIREDKNNGIYVEGLSEYLVSTSLDAYTMLKRGDNNFYSGARRFSNSSSSHRIFQLYIEYDNPDEDKLYKTKLNFCDLGGFGNNAKDSDLNKYSLSALGKVIKCMSNRTPGYISYRESKLTRLLQDSIDKTSNTWIISTVSPDIDSFDDILNTLKFTDQAKKVKVRSSTNTGEAKQSGKMEELQKEVNYLKDLLKLKAKGTNEEVHQQLYNLKKENMKLRKLVSSSLDLNQSSSAKGLTLKSIVTTARGIGGNDYFSSYDPTREDNSGIETSRNIKPNNRYASLTQNTPIPSDPQHREEFDPKNGNLNTQTTSITSNLQQRLSRGGRSSTELQFAGAKILAGTYSKVPKRSGSMTKEDDIPVRIRSQKKIELKNGSKTISLNRITRINEKQKENKKFKWKISYLNELEKKMKQGFQYN